MYSLNVLKKLNRADPKPTGETELTRHCSYVDRAADEAVVIHSAKQRSTRCIQGKVNRKNFLLKVCSTNSLDRIDEIIEAYFAQGKARAA